MELTRPCPQMYSHLMTEMAYEELQENPFAELYNTFTIDLADSDA